jgi:hypothetical protein
VREKIILSSILVLLIGLCAWRQNPFTGWGWGGDDEGPGGGADVSAEVWTTSGCYVDAATERGTPSASAQLNDKFVAVDCDHDLFRWEIVGFVAPAGAEEACLTRAEEVVGPLLESRVGTQLFESTAGHTTVACAVMELVDTRATVALRMGSLREGMHRDRPLAITCATVDGEDHLTFTPCDERHTAELAGTAADEAGCAAVVRQLAPAAGVVWVESVRPGTVLCFAEHAETRASLRK